MNTIHLNKDNIQDMVKYIAISRELINEIIPLETLGKLNIYEFNLLIGIWGLLSHGLDDISLTANGVCALIKPNNSTIITKGIAESTSKSLIEKIRMNSHFKQMFDVFMVEYEDQRNKHYDGMRIKIWRDYRHLFGVDRENGSYILLKFKELKTINSIYGKMLYIVLAGWRGIGKVKIAEQDIMVAFGDEDRNKTRQSVRRNLLSLSKFFKGLSLDIESKKNVVNTVDVYDEENGVMNDVIYYYIFRFQKNLNFWKKKKEVKVSD